MSARSPLRGAARLASGHADRWEGPSSRRVGPQTRQTCHDGSMSDETRREQQLTESGHHIVINGRRWRATDPSIPASLRDELVSALMTARRAVRTDESARPAVHDAKVALGERGELWWEPTTPEGRVDRLQRAARALLRHRGDDGAITVEELATLSPGSGIELADAERAVEELTGKSQADCVHHAELTAGSGS